MRRSILTFLLCIFFEVSICSAACNNIEPLFVIEHSKNGNAVRYEACLDEDGGLSSPEPVIAYWVLENGQREELNSIERARGYGVVVRERKGKEVVRISVVSLKAREITVEKTGPKYTALMLVSGRECILERVFIKSHDLVFGIPVVEYIDLFGKTKGEGLRVTEHIGKSQL
jgi:hypothetical protein